MKQIVTITGENMNVVMNNAAEATATVPAGIAAVGHKPTKAQMRIAALKAAGVDVSNYFTLGDEQVVKAVDGAVVPVTDEDTQTMDVVGKKIVNGGYISNWSLFRRWVMAQMFRMLREMEEDGRYNFNKLLQRNGYEYQWKMVEHELNAQDKMARHGDMQNYKMRNRWFNNEVVANMAEDYIEKLKAYVDDTLIYRTSKSGVRRYRHTCKGVAYVKFMNDDIFVADLNKKVYSPLRRLANDMRYTNDATALLRLVREFNKGRKHLVWGTKQSCNFINAYKGSGAYFTMRNLIMFHGARFVFAGETTSREASLNKVESAASQYANEGWQMMGLLKKLIKESGISIKGKIDEWKK